MAEIWPSASISPWASVTVWVISPRTWANCSAVWLIFEKDSPKFCSCVWKRSVSFSTSEKEVPTMLSSQREATSFCTSSFWYSFRLPATCRIG